MQELNTKENTLMKECFKCGVVKPLHDFYAHPKMADGYLNKCKECNKKDVRDAYLVNVQDPLYVIKERERGRDKHYRLYANSLKTDPEVKKKAMAKYRDKYPEKRRAVLLSQHIYAPSGSEKHHWSYNEQHYKDVIILPASLHIKIHRYLIYDKRTKMYKTIEGTLLDTRQKHELFISKVEEIF